jgi:hypothetical protein
MDCVVFAFVRDMAAVEMEEAKKKIPASAIPLSIGGVLLWCRQRGWRRSVDMTNPLNRDNRLVQRAHH